MNEDRIRQAQHIRDTAGPNFSRPQAIIIDDAGNALLPPDQPGRHPQMRQRATRKLQPWYDDQSGGNESEQRDIQSSPGDRQRDGVNVSVHNDGRYYRTTREEMHVKAGSMLIDFLAWPFRLVKGMIEALANSLVGLFSFVLKLLIIPTVLFLGYGIYQTSKDRPAAETAQIVGKESVGVVGGLLKGIWNGITGKSDPAAPAGKSQPKPVPKDKTSGAKD